ncbi:MAG: hypothetical protein C6P37_07365 [Caldibacillus debilis]|uniref:Uncharacterized protein n=1 Tax=Caldibacillus debilis TaxID=301148 RepID=A0A3E0K591_9BACI|nr:MAG: hypothetical protein C6P37_07365 [Caldibacillus debilis]
MNLSARRAAHKGGRAKGVFPPKGGKAGLCRKGARSGPARGKLRQRALSEEKIFSRKPAGYRPAFPIRRPFAVKSEKGAGDCRFPPLPGPPIILPGSPCPLPL